MPHLSSSRQTKSSYPKAPLKPIPAFEEPFSRIMIDCVGPLPKTKRGKGPFIFYQERWAGGFCGGATRKNSDVKGGVTSGKLNFEGGPPKHQ